MPIGSQRALMNQTPGSGTVAPTPGDTPSQLLTGTVNWPPLSPTSNNTVVNHGLGAPPTGITPTVSAKSFPAGCVVNIVSTTSTQITFNVQTVDGSNPGLVSSATVSLYIWL